MKKKKITQVFERAKVSFWIKDLNNKDNYKLIITNEIRKIIIKG